MVPALSLTAAAQQPDISINIAQQSVNFLMSCALGMLLGAIYDVFRITRKAFPLPSFLIAVEDILFFLICAVLSFTYMMNYSEGRLRWFVLVGQLLGACVYYFTVGCAVMAAADAIIAFFRRFFHFLWSITVRPVFRLTSALVKAGHRTLKKREKELKKASERAKYSLKHRRVLLYNFSKARSASRRIRKRRKEGEMGGGQAQKAKS